MHVYWKDQLSNIFLRDSQSNTQRLQKFTLNKRVDKLFCQNRRNLVVQSNKKYALQVWRSQDSQWSRNQNRSWYEQIRNQMVHGQMLNSFNNNSEAPQKWKISSLLVSQLFRRCCLLERKNAWYLVVINLKTFLWILFYCCFEIRRIVVILKHEYFYFYWWGFYSTKVWANMGRVNCLKLLEDIEITFSYPAPQSSDAGWLPYQDCTASNSCQSFDLSSFPCPLRAFFRTPLLFFFWQTLLFSWLSCLSFCTGPNSIHHYRQANI